MHFCVSKSRCGVLALTSSQVLQVCDPSTGTSCSGQASTQSPCIGDQKFRVPKYASSHDLHDLDSQSWYGSSAGHGRQTLSASTY